MDEGDAMKLKQNLQSAQEYLWINKF